MGWVMPADSNPYSGSRTLLRRAGETIFRNLRLVNGNFETTFRGDFKAAERDFGMENKRYKTYQTQLGRRIQKLRNEAGVTQEELANKVERSSEQISNIERGKSWPSFELIFDIAEALNVSPAKFLDWAVPAKRTELQAKRERLISRFGTLLESSEPVSAEEVLEIAQALVKKGG